MSRIKICIIAVTFLIIGVAIFYTLDETRSHSGKIQKKTINMADMTSHATGWNTRCLKDVKDKCEIFQNFFLKKNNEVIKLLEVSFGRIENNQYVMAMATPAGIDASKGYEFQIDNHQVMKLPIQSCSQKSCIAASKIETALFQKFKKGNLFNIYFMDAAGRPVKIELSLDNFTKVSKEI